MAIEMIKLTETHFKSAGSWSNPSSICHFEISIVIIGFINSLLIINVFKWWYLILPERFYFIFFPSANSAIYRGMCLTDSDMSFQIAMSISESTDLMLFHYPDLWWHFRKETGSLLDHNLLHNMYDAQNSCSFFNLTMFL